MEWRDRAACRDSDPELFFPVGASSGPAQVQIAQAKSVCASCPVRRSCLDWAMASGNEVGIWGGLDEQERRALKRRWARAQRIGS